MRRIIIVTALALGLAGTGAAGAVTAGNAASAAPQVHTAAPQQAPPPVFYHT
jgi:hypothetical protein